MVTLEQARQDTLDALGDDLSDADYITQEFLDEVRANPVEEEGEIVDPPKEAAADGNRVMAAGAGQTWRRAWVYRPVFYKADNKYAFYWYTAKEKCTSRTGYRNFRKWEKTSTFCQRTGDVVYAVYWWE